MIALYLAVNRLVPRLLGVDTPREQIVRAADACGANAVGLWIGPSNDLRPVARNVRWLLGKLPRRLSLWLGGGGAPMLGVTDPRLSVVTSFAELDGSIVGLS
jgi:hypothetical protein